MFADVNAVLESFVKEEIALRRAEGVKMAFVESALFVDGEAYPLHRDAAFLGPLLGDQRVITLEHLKQVSPTNFDVTNSSSEAAKFVQAFIEAGYFYPVDT
jgi:hypothetical protein